MKVYLNTAGTGLLSPAAVAAAQKFQNETLVDPSKAFLNWMEKDLPGIRKNAAGLLNASEEQISFLPNFSFALSAIIQGLQGRVKKVLLYKADYPSLNLPFELGNFEIHYVDSTDGFHISVDDVIRKINKEKIEVVALSHVQFLSGFKIDLDAVGQYCKEKGVVFIVDGTQSMGAVPIAFQHLPVDVLIGSSYKWLNGGFGSAILCIKEPFIDRFPPRTAGYGSLDKHGLQSEYRPSNKSFEPGHMNAPALLQLNDGMLHKLKIGLEAINKHNAELMRKLQNSMMELPYPVIGGEDLKNRLHIFCFKAEKAVAEYLKKEGFALTWRQGSIRISPHYYNTEMDIEMFVHTLKRWKA